MTNNLRAAAAIIAAAGLGLGLQACGPRDAVETTTGEQSSAMQGGADGTAPAGAEASTDATGEATSSATPNNGVTPNGPSQSGSTPSGTETNVPREAPQ